jgi:hypothetical protein
LARFWIEKLSGSVLSSQNFVLLAMGGTIWRQAGRITGGKSAPFYRVIAMFGIGIAELAIIAIIGLLFLGVVGGIVAAVVIASSSRGRGGE